MLDVEMLKKTYRRGMRICLEHMADDTAPIPDNTLGTIDHVDDIGTIHVVFDNKRELGIFPGVDYFHLM